MKKDRIVATEANSCPLAPEATAEAVGTALISSTTAPSAVRRPFVGYDREDAAYARMKPELLTRAEGKFVVLVGDDLRGPVETFGEALRLGYRQFGLGPLYVKQVLAEEPVAETGHDL